MTKNEALAMIPAPMREILELPEPTATRVLFISEGKRMRLKGDTPSQLVSSWVKLSFKTWDSIHLYAGSVPYRIIEVGLSPKTTIGENLEIIRKLNKEEDLIKWLKRRTKS